MQQLEKPMQWYFHPNIIVRMMYTRIHEGLDKNLNLSPNYSNNPKIGVVIGTYGASPYIDLQLHYLKNVNKIEKILVHDDCSPEKNKIKGICNKYNVDFISTEKNLWHKTCIGSLGDENCFYEGLNWAKKNNLDILVKISRRLIPCYNWVDDFKKLVLESDGLTFSSFCTKDPFPFRTEMVAMNVNAWTIPFINDKMKWYLDNEMPVFAEFWYHELAKHLDNQNFSKKYLNYKKEHYTNYLHSGYVHWYDCLGICRYNEDNRHENVLWHQYSKDEDYYKKSKEIFGNIYTLNDFKGVKEI